MQSASFRTKIAILSAVLISESLSATLLMPFVGLYVAHLQSISPNEAGYMSGVLVSVFQLGQMLTGKMWGNASDRVGRKPMIQMGLIANAVSATFFGMSPNLPFCILMRFIHGCANGNVLVAKTVIADITDKTNEGAGFAAISIFWGVGSVIGPALGGLLYDPAHNKRLQPWFGELDDNSLFMDHPAFLPCFVIAAFSLLTLIVISAVLPETSRRRVDPVLSLFTWSRESKVVVVVDSDSSSVLSNSGRLAPEDSVHTAQYDGSDSDQTAPLPSVIRRRGGPAYSAKTTSTVHSPFSHDDTRCGGGGGGAAAAAAAGTETVFFSEQEEETDRSLSLAHLAPPTVESTGVFDPDAEPRRRRNTVSGGATSPSRSRGRSPVPTGRKGTPLPPPGADAAVMVPNTAADELAANGSLNDVPTGTIVDTWKQFGYKEALRLPSTRLTLVMYMCIASTECALLEIIPLWAIASPAKGGLDFSSTDIGWMLMISSLVCVVANVFFARVMTCFGSTRRLWDFAVLFWALTSIITPFSVFVPREHTFWFAATITSMREIGLSWAYSLIYMFVVRSAPERFVGSMNGIGQSIASFSRMVTMLVIPPIFAWSLNGVNHPFPFNYHFAYWITSVPLLISFLVSSYLPARVTDGV